MLQPGGRFVYSDFHPSWAAARFRRTFRSEDGRRLDPRTNLPRPGVMPREDQGAPNAEVAVAVDVDRFWDLFLGVLATYP